MAMRRLRRRRVGYVGIADEALADGDLLKSGDHPEQRRLAAAGRAEQRSERAILDREAEIGDRGDRAVALRHPPQFDMGRGGGGGAPVCRARGAHPLIPADSMMAWVTRRWKMR